MSYFLRFDLIFSLSLFFFFQVFTWCFLPFVYLMGFGWLSWLETSNETVDGASLDSNCPLYEGHRGIGQKLTCWSRCARVGGANPGSNCPNAKLSLAEHWTPIVCQWRHWEQLVSGHVALQQSPRGRCKALWGTMKVLVNAIQVQSNCQSIIDKAWQKVAINIFSFMD